MQPSIPGAPQQMPQNGQAYVPPNMPTPSAPAVVNYQIPQANRQFSYPVPAAQPQLPQNIVVPSANVAPPYASLPPNNQTAQITPAMMAEEQANIIAHAILRSQNLLNQQPTPPLQYTQNTSIASANSVPSQESREPLQQFGIGRGERVIQPIHDMQREAEREEMQRRMAELLGNTDNLTPTQINTKTAKQIGRNPVNMDVQNAVQASEQVPPPNAPMATMPQVPQQAPTYIQNQPVMMASPSTPSVSQAQLQAQAQARAQAQAQAQAQARAQAQLQAQAQARAQAQAQAQAQARAQAQLQAQAQARQQQTAKSQDQPRNNTRVNQNLIQKVVDAIGPRAQQQGPSSTPNAPMPQPVQPIQPAYIGELEEQLATDMQEKNKISGMSARMSAELADDKLTLEAKKIKVTPDAQKATREADYTPKEVLESINSVNTVVAPNISSDEEPKTDNTQQEQAQ